MTVRSSHRRPAPVLALLAALALAACTMGAPARPGGGPAPTAGAKGKPSGSAKPAVPAGARVLGAADALVPATLIGKVKLISDQGHGVISNNGGTVISNGGATLISDGGLGLVSNNGGSFISDQGGGLIGKTKYGIRQAPAGLRETALADAEIEVLDGAGRPLADADGPIRVRTDATGAYRLEGKLPAENLVLRVKVAKAGALPGGELRALVPNPGGKEVAGTLDVDTPATLGATYVLEKFVQGRADVYARLPAREADLLKQAMGGALRAAADAPAYEAAAIAPAVDALQAANAPLKQALDRIESILLLGQSDLGAGQRATAVPLTLPAAIAATADGDLLVGEGFIGRVRRIRAADQVVAQLAAPGGPSELGYGVPGLCDMRTGPDGALYAVEEVNHRVVRLKPGAGPEVVAGNGTPDHGAPGGDARATALFPRAIAWGPDGTLHVAEEAGRANQQGRVLTVDAAGKLGEVPTPDPKFVTGSFNGIAVREDGTIVLAVADILTDRETKTRTVSGRLARLKPGGSWEFFHEGLLLGAGADLLDTPDGLLLAEDEGHRIWRLDDAMGKTLVAGTGRGGYAGDGGPATAAQLSQPTGLFRGADGRVYVADRGNALVRAIAPDGTIATVAGVHGVVARAQGQAFPVNTPVGLALDAEGRLLVCEGGSHTIKRFDGQRLEAFVGTDRGFTGDGGPAGAAQLDTPLGIGFHGPSGTLWIADRANGRIRRVGPDGRIDTAAGISRLATDKPLVDKPLMPAATYLGAPIGLAVGPDGFPAFTVTNNHQVVKLRADGQLALLAGAPYDPTRSGAGVEGDGGPAAAARLTSPTGLAYDPAGNLFVAEALSGTVRRIAADGTIDAYAGIGALQWLGDPARVDATQAREVALAIPFSVATDAAGNLYVGEIGTRNVRDFGLVAADDAVFSQLPAAPARIRRVAPDGRVAIVAGPGGKVMTDPASDDALVFPAALLVRPDGSLVVADPGTNQVRLIPKEALP